MEWIVEAESLSDFVDHGRYTIHTKPFIRCRECKYAHMTYNGECKYCDIWFPDEKIYMSGDYYCGSAERREE